MKKEKGETGTKREERDRRTEAEAETEKRAKVPCKVHDVDPAADLQSESQGRRLFFPKSTKNFRVGGVHGLARSCFGKRSWLCGVFL